MCGDTLAFAPRKQQVGDNKALVYKVYQITIAVIGGLVAALYLIGGGCVRNSLSLTHTHTHTTKLYIDCIFPTTPKNSFFSTSMEFTYSEGIVFMFHIPIISKITHAIHSCG